MSELKLPTKEERIKIHAILEAYRDQMNGPAKAISVYALKYFPSLLAAADDLDTAREQLAKVPDLKDAKRQVTRIFESCGDGTAELDASWVMTVATKALEAISEGLDVPSLASENARLRKELERLQRSHGDLKDQLEKE